MALNVEKSTSEALLNAPCLYDGRWNCRELDTDYSELVSSMRQFLDAEEGKSSPEGTESAALDGSSPPVTGITQQNPGCSKEMSLPRSSRLPRAKVKANNVERWPLTARHICGTDLPHRVHATVPYSGGQQVRGFDIIDITATPKVSPVRMGPVFLECVHPKVERLLKKLFGAGTE